MWLYDAPMRSAICLVVRPGVVCRMRFIASLICDLVRQRRTTDVGCMANVPRSPRRQLRRWRSRASQKRRADFLTADKSIVLLSEAKFLRLAARPRCSAQSAGTVPETAGENFSTSGRTALSGGAPGKGPVDQSRYWYQYLPRLRSPARETSLNTSHLADASNTLARTNKTSSWLAVQEQAACNLWCRSRSGHA